MSSAFHGISDKLKAVSAEYGEIMSNLDSGIEGSGVTISTLHKELQAMSASAVHTQAHIEANAAVASQVGEADDELQRHPSPRVPERSAFDVVTCAVVNA